MATPTPTNVEVLGTGTNATAFTTTASLSPAAGEYFLFIICSRDNPVPNVPTISNNGTLSMTWTDLSPSGTVTLTGYSTDSRISAFVGSAGSGSGTVTATYSATQSGATWAMTKITGADPTVGTAFRQAVAAGAVTTDANPTITLAALRDAESLVVSFFLSQDDGGATSTIPTVGTSQTSLGTDASATSPGQAGLSQHGTNTATPDANISPVDVGHHEVAVEIVASSGITIFRRRRS